MKISWDDPGSRLFETGVDRGAFYPETGAGVPWNGLTAVNETDPDQSAMVVYLEGRKLINQITLGSFTASISAVTYPDEVYAYDGFDIPQDRPRFNLSYRTSVGNDIKGDSYAYRLHLVFNASISAQAKEYSTLNAQSDLPDFVWDLSTFPVPVPNSRNTGHVFIDSDKCTPEALAAIEAILYGEDDGDDPRFPTIQDLVDVFEEFPIFQVVDNGDGTVTITGPNSWVYSFGLDMAYFSSPSVTLEGDYILAKNY